MKQGRIVASRSAQESLKVMRGPDGPETLGPEDGALFVFYGARLRMGELLRLLHEYTSDIGPVSSAVLEATLRRWLQNKRAYVFASFVRVGANVMMVPTALPTEGVVDEAHEAALYHLPRVHGSSAAASERSRPSDGLTVFRSCCSPTVD